MFVAGATTPTPSFCIGFSKYCDALSLVWSLGISYVVTLGAPESFGSTSSSLKYLKARCYYPGSTLVK
jgi:hypothetical protein